MSWVSIMSKGGRVFSDCFNFPGEDFILLLVLFWR